MYDTRARARELSAVSPRVWIGRGISLERTRGSDSARRQSALIRVYISIEAYRDLRETRDDGAGKQAASLPSLSTRARALVWRFACASLRAQMVPLGVFRPFWRTRRYARYTARRRIELIGDVRVDNTLGVNVSVSAR